MILEILQKVVNQFSTRPVSEHSRKVTTSDGSKYLFMMFRVTGIMVTNRFKVIYVIYSLIFNMFTMILIPLMFCLSYFRDTEEFQINQFLTSLQLCLNIFTCGMKFCALAYMRPYLFKFEAILDKLDDRIEYPEEIREAQKVIRFGNRTIATFSIVYYSCSAVIVIGSVYMGRPPYSLYNPYLKWRESTTKFITASALEYVLISMVTAQQIVNDTYAIIYVRILHTHLKILIGRVLRIGTDSKCTQDDNTKELVQCIHDHKLIIELISSIQPVISTTYFIQYLTTAVCLGATLINMSISNDKSTFCGSALYASCLIMEILPICYLANCLAGESGSLPEAIFHINWMDQSPEFRRLCLFFMHRSQQPIVFYAGKMFEISLNTFMSIIKCSFSVYTLLDKMEFAERFN